MALTAREVEAQYRKLLAEIRTSILQNRHPSVLIDYEWVKGGKMAVERIGRVLDSPPLADNQEDSEKSTATNKDAPND
jgi:hypothetical protein